MADCRDIITDALRELGVLAAGETATADDAVSGLAALNRLVDAWAAERLMIYTNRRTTWTLTANIQDYTVGPGGDVNIPWPNYVEHVNFLRTDLATALEFQLQPLTNDAWSRVPIKSLSSPYPTCYYWNPTFPLGTLSLWPVPSSAVLDGVFYAPEQVTEFASLSTAISLPSGYRRMLVKNLALEMGPSYERPASDDLVQQALESKAVVKRANITLQDMQTDAGALIQGRNRRFIYSILTG